MKAPALLALTAGLFTLPAPLKAAEDREDVAALQGTWQVVCQQRAGRATARPRSMLWIIEGQTIWVVPSWMAEREQQASAKEKEPARGGKPAGSPRGLRMTFRLGGTKSPRHIDINGLRKSTSLGVYQLEGDVLTLCMGVTLADPVYDKRAKSDEGTRPTAISPAAGTVIVLKRIK